MIYLDYNATTPISNRVKQCIIENINLFHNPSSIYKESDVTKSKIKQARINLGELINALPEQIIFTGCATESNNAVINSCINASKLSQKHIVVSSVEHSAIIETVKFHQKHKNIDVTFLPVDNYGRIDLKELKRSITKHTVLVSIMMVNNEIGNIYPIKEITNLVHDINPKIKMHTDATQAIGKMKVDVQNINVDFLTLSGHKFYAPKGIGALYVKDIESFTPFIIGGHQENGKRAGTENLISIIAMGEAAKETTEFIDYNSITRLRDNLENKILKFISGSRILGDQEHRVCNTTCILIDDISGIDICEAINQLGDVCISSGSACNSIELKPSHVMEAMGVNQIPIRISLGKTTTEQELTKFLQLLIQINKKFKKNK